MRTKRPDMICSSIRRRIDDRLARIEHPVEDLLDVNGWDIKKALLLRANPVLSEWLVSPIRYREDKNCARKLLAARTRFRCSARYHYLHLGRSSYRKELAGRGGEPGGVNDPALLNDANAAFRDIVAGGL